MQDVLIKLGFNVTALEANTMIAEARFEVRMCQGFPRRVPKRRTQVFLVIYCKTKLWQFSIEVGKPRGICLRKHRGGYQATSGDLQFVHRQKEANVAFLFVPSKAVLRKGPFMFPIASSLKGALKKDMG